MARLEHFGARGKNEYLRASDAGMLAKGHLIGAPAAGHAPLAGPHVAERRAVPAAGTHVSHIAAEAALNRPVVRTPVDRAIERTSAPVKTSEKPVAEFTRHDINGPSSGKLAAQKARGSLGIASQSASNRGGFRDPSAGFGGARRDPFPGSASERSAFGSTLAHSYNGQQQHVLPGAATHPSSSGSHLDQGDGPERRMLTTASGQNGAPKSSTSATQPKAASPYSATAARNPAPAVPKPASGSSKK